ncbi:MAG TPA: methyltransferase domain-containing protein [Candidatus Bathyarchaeota archaeon]|nr:methyltransferase domain-containing protein [Candidatus Bathyarchaeota archaeon]
MVYPKKVYFRDHVFLVDEHVYEPAEDTFLLAENMTVTEDDTVLDMGTGCGILAVLAAEKARRVLAVDVNPHALQCAARNVETNGVKEKIEFRHGDLFQPLKQNERFSLMLFNAPYLPSEPDEERSWIGKAWAGGRNGRKVVDRFVIDAPNFLAAGGRIQLVQSSLSDVDRTIEMFGELGLRAAVVAQVKVAFESIFLVEAKR